MHRNWTIKLTLLAIATFAILSFSTATSAFGQSPSGSDATSTSKPTPTPSDDEIRRVAVRALDKVEALRKSNEAKDEVISEQDKLLAESEKGRKQATDAAVNFREAFERQKEATDLAKEGWKADQERVRQLEKKVRGSNNRTKWMAIGAAAAIITTILIK